MQQPQPVVTIRKCCARCTPERPARAPPQSGDTPGIRSHHGRRGRLIHPHGTNTGSLRFLARLVQVEEGILVNRMIQPEGGLVITPKKGRLVPFQRERHHIELS